MTYMRALLAALAVVAFAGCAHAQHGHPNGGMHFNRGGSHFTPRFNPGAHVGRQFGGQRFYGGRNRGYGGGWGAPFLYVEPPSCDLGYYYDPDSGLCLPDDE